MRLGNTLTPLVALLISIHGSALGAAGIPSGKPEAPAPEASPAARALKVGDPAPPLSVSVFLKGEPIHELEKGKWYLVEFWATWCTACKMQVPHLSQVARDHRGKVTILSVAVAEQGHEGEPYSAHLPKLRRFMESRGGRAMDYAVAMDDDACTMMKTWLEPAGDGFPTAVLVDPEGRIAWIGFPGETLPAILDLAIENKLDGAAIQQLGAREEASRKSAREFQAKVEALAGSKKFSKALEMVDDRIAKVRKPGMPTDSNLLSARYQLLTYLDPKEARKTGEEYLAQYQDYPVYLSFFTMSLTMGVALSGGKFAYQDCELALQAARMALENGDPCNPLALQDLARAYALLKDYPNAVKFQERAMESLDDYGRGPQRGVFEKTLTGYKAKLNRAGHR